MEREQNKVLEKLYIEEVKLGNSTSSQRHQIIVNIIDEDLSKKNDQVLKTLLKKVIETAKQTSPDFSELYRELYYGGSYYDKLKVKSTEYEFDLNVVFASPKSSYHICNLGDDHR